MCRVLQNSLDKVEKARKKKAAVGKDVDIEEYIKEDLAYDKVDSMDDISKDVKKTMLKVGVDTDEKENGELAVQSRSVDAEAKSQNELDAEARNEDEVDKNGQSGLKGSERNQDFVSQHFHHDHVDWSGGRPPYELR